MLAFTEILPGVRLRCVQTDRFKSNCLSLSLLRPLCREEAGKNALLSNVLMQGTELHPDITSLSLAMDELYGTSMGPLCRKNGEIQTVGFYMSCLDDRYALPGDQVLEPALELMAELLLNPRLEDGCFPGEVVALEKENLINTIESDINDKRYYANAQMLKAMCREDVYAVPRLGEREDVMDVSPRELYAHYRKILKTSQIEIFYGGSLEEGEIAALLKKTLAGLPRGELQTLGFGALPRHEGVQYLEESMDVTQGKLSMGFTTGLTARDEGYPAMVVFNTVFGGDATSKLFMNVRERLSLCYYAGSSLISPKGILTVSCGIDTCNYESARAEILRQLELCRAGDITPEELNAAKTAVVSSLQSMGDSLGATEEFSSFQVLSGFQISPEEYRDAVLAVSVEAVAEAARQVELDTIFFLKGVGA